MLLVMLLPECCNSPWSFLLPWAVESWFLGLKGLVSPQLGLAAESPWVPPFSDCGEDGPEGG